MSYFRTCPYCDSNLDPSETCDCRIEKTEVTAQEDKKVITLIIGKKKIAKEGC